MGWETRAMRVEKAAAGRGSADQFVRQQFPRELKAHRTRHVSQAFVTMIDGGRHGVDARLGQLDEACHAGGIDVRTPGERVAVFIPTWNIETWFAYLDGATVDEVRSDYPRLAKERDCQRHVAALTEMCRAARSHEFSVQLRAFDAAKSGNAAGLAALLALCSGLLQKSMRGGLIVVGQLNLGGSIDPIHNAVNVAELAVEKGATTLLVPISARRQLMDLSDDMAAKLGVQFYVDGRDALLKGLLE